MKFMMKAKNSILTSALLASALCATSPSLAQETIDTRIGKLTFESGYPSKETVQKLYDEMDFQRAAQAYLWGIPAVGLAEWRLAHRNVFKAKNGEMLSYLDFKEKLGILTPNYTTPYIVTLIDLQESGPIVLELPRGLMAGMIMDAWQRVIADLGVVGPDKGNGGKYLILPPGHEMVKPEGYYVVQRCIGSSASTPATSSNRACGPASRAVEQIRAGHLCSDCPESPTSNQRFRGNS